MFFRIKDLEKLNKIKGDGGCQNFHVAFNENSLKIFIDLVACIPFSF